MTEIKKGTPVWVWDDGEKYKAVYIAYNDLIETNYRHVVVLHGNVCADSYRTAEPINETNEKAMQLIAEAKEKIAEAEKLLNAL